jgi:two-component system cell cycle sensor histidine kinase/response regulator CckA
MAIFRGDRSAFGAPGIEPQWTHGDKGGVGTAYAASTAHSDRYNSMASVGNPFTILLVDDDEAIRRLIQRILQQQGFHVIEASDGAEALKVASAYAEPVDLLLTDVIMPKVNGLVLAQLLSQERPGIGVLYMSGYVEQSMLLQKHPESILLQKPFTPDALIAAVRQILASQEQQ